MFRTAWARKVIKEVIVSLIHIVDENGNPICGESFPKDSEFIVNSHHSYDDVDCEKCLQITANLSGVQLHEEDNVQQNTD